MINLQLSEKKIFKLKYFPIGKYTNKYIEDIYMSMNLKFYRSRVMTYRPDNNITKPNHQQ